MLGRNAIKFDVTVYCVTRICRFAWFQKFSIPLIYPLNLSVDFLKNIATPVIVTTPKELAAKTGLGLLLTSRENKSFLITALFTIFVCALVATQTLRASILSYQDEFAIFLAQGVSIFSLQLVALEMAFWLGALSTAVAVSAAFVMQAIFSAFKIEFAMSLALIGFVAALMMIIALFAGLVSCYVITTLEKRTQLQ